MKTSVHRSFFARASSYIGLFLVRRCSSGAREFGDEFPCGSGVAEALPPKTFVSTGEAEARRCCVELPCQFRTGCWAGQMPPLYSATRVQALSREESRSLEYRLLWREVSSGNLTLTRVGSMPNHTWYRIPVTRPEFNYFYEGIERAFEAAFNASLRMPVDLDIFFVTDFDERWADDETYRSDYPGAAYWIHNDCSNFRICYEESGYSHSDFTGNGVAFVLPVALPSQVDFRDGHEKMPAALELYNISSGHRDPSGRMEKPWNRQWMEVHRYNLGEIIFFNAFRWHSGHVPRRDDFLPGDNEDTKRAETVGFAAELRGGKEWVLFRMCKGSTDDSVKKKILETDINPTSTGASQKTYEFGEEATLSVPLGSLKGIRSTEL